MIIKVYKTYEELSKASAQAIVEYIKSKPEAVVCLASGHTPLGVFKHIVQMVREQAVTLNRCTFVGLDEWLGISSVNPGSCRYLMDEHFFKPSAIAEENIIFFDGLHAEPQQEIDRINKFLDSRGGLDIMLVGIGLNGHIAMNEPGTSFDAVAHISTLADETKAVAQKYFTGHTVLTEGLTLGLKQFREAKLPLLMANGESKAAIIKKILTTDPSSEYPASVIQTMPQGLVMLDEAAASIWLTPDK
jgi:glucosamine-6-phosphate isomerase